MLNAGSQNIIRWQGPPGAPRGGAVHWQEAGIWNGAGTGTCRNPLSTTPPSHPLPPLSGLSTPRTNLLLAWMSQQPLSPICQALESPGRRPKDQGRASTGSSPLDSAGKNGDLQQLVPGPLEPRGLHLPWLPEGTSIPCTPKMTVKPPGAGVL